MNSTVYEIFKHVSSKMFCAVVPAVSKAARDMRRMPGFFYAGDTRIPDEVTRRVTHMGSTVLLDTLAPKKISKKVLTRKRK